MKKIPKLCKHRKTGYAYIYVDRKQVYFGKYGSPEATAKYRAYVNKITSSLDGVDAANDPTVAEVVLAFFQAHQFYYMKNGRQTKQLDRFKIAVEFPLELYPDLPVREFGPRKLLEVRAAMERSGRFARSYINTLINCFRHVIKYAVSIELVSPDVLVALQSVDALKRGRSIARECQPVLAVPAGDVERTIRELSPVVGDMVRVQRLTGMRPGEVCSMRVGDIDQSGDLWIYTLRTDKTDYRREVGNKKRIPLGPRAQAVLFPYLLEKENHPDDFIFTPAEAVAAVKLERRRNAVHPRRELGDDRTEYRPCYDACSYRRAVHRAAERAGVRPWSPNQLRHLFASEIRARYGLESAQVCLGHANANVTQIYAERDFNAAKEIAKEIG